MKFIKTARQKNSLKDFLLVLPFLLLIAVFAYYPLYGWVYAFFDYKPPFPLSWDKFVGFKWFISMVENPIKVKKAFTGSYQHLCHERAQSFVLMVSYDFCSLSE